MEWIGEEHLFPASIALPAGASDSPFHREESDSGAADSLDREGHGEGR